MPRYAQGFEQRGSEDMRFLVSLISFGLVLLLFWKRDRDRKSLRQAMLNEGFFLLANAIVVGFGPSFCSLI